MLSNLVKNSLQVLTLGARDHASLLVHIPDICAEVLKRDQDRCHVCGMQVPQMMEIDHLNGHRKSTAKDLACICPFCHALKHPLWAGSRKRIIPIFAPDVSQQDLHRLAWVCLGFGDDEAAGVDLEEILGDVRIRHEELRAELGCDDAQSLFEAAFAARDMMEEKVAAATFLKIDQFLRFWPAELHWEREKLAPGSRLSTWSVGGFRQISHMAKKNIRMTVEPDYERLQAAGEKVLSGALDQDQDKQGE